MKTNKRKVVLLGEGIHQHVLHGDFLMEENHGDFAKIIVNKPSLLKHETPSGGHAEHNALQMTNGEWEMGRQVEYNPFTRDITRVWD